MFLGNNFCSQLIVKLFVLLLIGYEHSLLGQKGGQFHRFTGLDQQALIIPSDTSTTLINTNDCAIILHRTYVTSANGHHHNQNPLFGGFLDAIKR